MGWRWCPGAPSAWRTTILVLQVVLTALAKRHVVYWNTTNTRLTQGDFSVQVNISDYLDIYCPHYPPGEPAASPPERPALYLVGAPQFRGCVETPGAMKRWECSDPHARHGPVRFSEKIQRFTPFSLGFEFLPGHHYYFSSLPTEGGVCLKLRVTVCCESATMDSSQVQGTLLSHNAASTTMKTTLALFLVAPLPFLLAV